MHCKPDLVAVPEQSQGVHCNLLLGGPLMGYAMGLTKLVWVHWIRPWGGREWSDIERNHSLFGCCLEGKGTLFPPIISTLLEYLQ
ncbi:hypothetical protein ACB092_12G108600 [Castanea dentata]